MIFVINLQQVEFDWVFRNMIRGLSMYNKRVGEKGNKKAWQNLSGFLLWVGDDLLSHRDAVSSARQGLTSLFGMGRGAPLRNSRHNICKNDFIQKKTKANLR